MSKNYDDEYEDEINLYSPINDDDTSSISFDNNKDLSILELGSNVKKYFRFPNNSNDISVTVSKIKDPETATIISEGKNEPLDKDIKNEKTKKPIIKGKPKAFKIEFKHGVNLEKMMDIEESNGDFVFSSVEIDADYSKLNKFRKKDGNPKLKKLESFGGNSKLSKNIKKYVERELTLLKDKKENLSNDLKSVRKQLDKKEVVDLNDFMYKNSDNIQEKYSDIKDCLHPVFSFIFIKIIGAIFITLYFVGIYEIIGLMNALKEEILSSFNLIIRDIKRETNFYQNYINVNLNTPSLDLFFLTSILSDFITNLISFPMTVLIILIINCVIIYFGFGYFTFHQGEDLNIKYSFKENIILILIYLGLYFFTGIIALFPQKIIQAAYVSFDVKNDYKISKAPMKGYIFTYIFSIVVSSIIKILLDRNYVFDKVKLIINNKKDDSFFSYIIIIILIYGCSMIISMILYFPLWITFEKKEKESITIKSFKICGFMIYQEKYDESCCENCLTNCSISADNCGYCLGCHCCNCFGCCCDESYKNSDESSTLCIIYKIKGIVPWFTGLIAPPLMSFLVILMYFYEILNLGFKPILSEYLDDKNNETQITIMNIIYFSSLIFLYMLNLFIGFIDSKCNKKDINLMNEYEKNGIFYFIFITCIINIIFSSFSYFDTLNNAIYYLITFSVGISEYVNILVLHFAQMDSIGSLDIIGKSFAISFYKLIFKIIKIALNLISSKGQVLIQFIVGLIVCFIQSLSILVIIFCPK